MLPPGPELQAAFGRIDIYLFDQLLKGAFDDRPAVLDAGCGDGRNLIYFLRRGFDCFAADRDPAAIARVKQSPGVWRRGSRRITSTRARSRVCRGATAR